MRTTNPRLLFPGRRAVLPAAALFVFLTPAAAQRQVSASAQLVQQLDRLGVVGRVLHIAAHPDDERTNFLAWSARERHFRTAYLSLTRGEGGQNLIGPELFEQLGVIRTQELLAARRVDGAEQFFTRAIDFGFSKTAQETMDKWGREQVLGDIVWVVRDFRPDVIVLGFSGTTRDGHGHHQTSAILGQEAFRAAADPRRFPEQLKLVAPWQAKRLMWVTAGFMRFSELEDSPASKAPFDSGAYNPVLGYSYNEIAGQSRSNHRTQGFGAAEPKGSAPGVLIVTGGDPVQKDFFDGIDTTWNRVPGGAALVPLCAKARSAFDPREPWKVVAPLAGARAILSQLDHPDARWKLRELDETIALAAGLWAEVASGTHTVTPGDKLNLTLTAISRSPLAAEMVAVKLEGPAGLPAFETPLPLPANQRVTKQAAWIVPAGSGPTSPAWLRRAPQGALYDLPRQQDVGPAQGPPVVNARFTFRVAGATIEIERPVLYRYVDQTRGELTRPLVIAPAVSLALARPSFVFAGAQARKVEVEVRANRAGASGSLQLEAPAGWTITPAQQQFALQEAGHVAVLAFEVKPPAQASRGSLRAVADMGGQTLRDGMTVIAYEHIPAQTLFPPAEARLTREDVKIAARRIGYIMGPGDAVPDALKQLGCDVTLLEPADLTRGDLARFDAVITGVRTWNNRADLRANWPRLLEFAAKGGTLLVQYNDSASFIFGRGEAPQASPGPYPFRVGRERVTVEESPVKFLAPDHPLLRFPNRISAADFDGWIQERGLYFASEWDPRYQALFEMADPGEKPLQGGLLFTRYGQGAYVFAPLAFFRQLPAGVPGAYKLFANLVSAAQAPAP